MPKIREMLLNLEVFNMLPLLLLILVLVLLLLD